MKNYQVLYHSKCSQFEELNQQFMVYEEDTKLLIDDLQRENNQLKKKYEKVQKQNEDLKDKRKEQIKILQKENQLLKKDSKAIRQQSESWQRQVIQLQNRNEAIQNQLRSANTMLEEYQFRVQKTMEQLAILQMQLEQMKQSNQETIARLKGQIRQTEDQLHAIKVKHQKYNTESEFRKSQLSWSSLSFKQKQKDQLSRTKNNEANYTQCRKRKSSEKKLSAFEFGFLKSKNLGSDIKENIQATGFQNTLGMMVDLLQQLNQKCKTQPFFSPYKKVKDI